MTAAGELLITARRYRTQDANRTDARARLAEMIARAHMAPRKRKATRPSKAAKARRVDTKKQRERGQGGARKGKARLMYDFKIEAADKATLYRDLATALEALVAASAIAVANMANAAALIWESLPDINWAGFYRNVDGELVLGPFQGRPACIRIPLRPGRVRTAATTREVAAGRGRPRLSRPHRLRQRVEQRDRGSARPRRRVARRARHRQPEPCALRRGRPGRVRQARQPACEGDLAQLLEPFVAERARDQHHRDRQLARIVAAKASHQWPRIAARRRPEHQRGHVLPADRDSRAAPLTVRRPGARCSLRPPLRRGFRRSRS